MSTAFQVAPSPVATTPTKGLRTTFVVLSIASALAVAGALSFAGLGLADASVAEFATAQAAAAFAALAHQAAIAVALVWLHRAWSAIPTELRGGRTPTEAFLLLVPGYGLYWMFAYNHALAHATARASGRPTPDSVTSAATLAGILQLVPFLNVLVAPFAWARFMGRVDELRG